MGTLVCSRCKAKTEADSIEEGRKRLDHGVGLYIGKPCQDGKAELFFTNGTIETKKSTFKKPTEKKSKIDTKFAKSKSD